MKKLKTSFDTLVKFSFLTTNDDQFTKEIALESRDQLQSILKDSPTNNKKEKAPQRSPELVDDSKSENFKIKAKNTTKNNKSSIKEEVDE